VISYQLSVISYQLFQWSVISDPLFQWSVIRYQFIRNVQMRVKIKFDPFGL